MVNNSNHFGSRVHYGSWCLCFIWISQASQSEWVEESENEDDDEDESENEEDDSGDDSDEIDDEDEAEVWH